MIDTLPQKLYLVVMGLAVIGWLGLILFPRWSRINFWLTSLVIPLILCATYMFLLLTFWFRPPVGSVSQFFSLEGIHEMFSNRGLFLVAWINLITMDLVVGAWMARKAAQIRMPYLYLLPCLILTFVFAGFGFALFALMVTVSRGWTEIAKFEGQPPADVLPVLAPAVSD